MHKDNFIGELLVHDIIFIFLSDSLFITIVLSKLCNGLYHILEYSFYSTFDVRLFILVSVTMC